MKALDAHVTLQRPEFEVDITLCMERPEVLSIFGPSGSGKSTVLRVLAGLEPASRGHVRVGDKTWQGRGRCLPPHRRHVGIVFQDARLFPNLNAAENLTLGARLHFGAVDTDRLADVCSMLNLGSLLARSVRGLSGGEKQRIAIGRCLLTQPDLLLLDEPLSALDADHQDEILHYLITLHRKLSIPIVHVSHDWLEVLRLADHVAMVERGRVLEFGPIREINARTIARQRHRLNLLEARVHAYDHENELIALQLGDIAFHVPGNPLPPGSRVRLLMDESSLIISRSPQPVSSALNVLPACVVQTRNSGPGTARVIMALQGQTVSAVITRRSVSKLDLAAGANVYLLIKSAAVQLVPG